MRSFFSLIHRYVGLVMAIFLFIAGLTGAILAWNHELDAALNSQWMKIQPPNSDAQQLDPLQLRERIQAHYPQARIDYVNLRERSGQTIPYWLEPFMDTETEEPVDLPND